jgi:hypothetical protein
MWPHGIATQNACLSERSSQCTPYPGFLCIGLMLALMANQSTQRSVHWCRANLRRNLWRSQTDIDQAVQSLGRLQHTREQEQSVLCGDQSLLAELSDTVAIWLAFSTRLRNVCFWDLGLTSQLCGLTAALSKCAHSSDRKFAELFPE